MLGAGVPLHGREMARRTVNAARRSRLRRGGRPALVNKAAGGLHYSGSRFGRARPIKAIASDGILSTATTRIYTYIQYKQNRSQTSNNNVTSLQTGTGTRKKNTTNP